MRSLKYRKNIEREKFKTLRSELPRKTIHRKSKTIWEILRKLPEFKDTETVSFYVSKRDNGEVETREMISDSLKMDKKIVVPYVDEKDLKLSQIQDLQSDLEIGNFGVLEPKKESRKDFPVKEVDLILIPGLAFDKEGNRLGYGKGYFDRLLKKASKKSTFLGLAFDFQITNHVPAGNRDIPVNEVITEEGLYNCQK